MKKYILIHSIFISSMLYSLEKLAAIHHESQLQEDCEVDQKKEALIYKAYNSPFFDRTALTSIANIPGSSCAFIGTQKNGVIVGNFAKQRARTLLPKNSGLSRAWIRNVACTTHTKTIIAFSTLDWMVIGILENPVQGKSCHLYSYIPSHRLNILSFSPTGDSLATGSQDGSVFIWDVERAKNFLHAQQLQEPSKHGKIISLIHVTDTTICYNASSKDNGFVIHDIRSGGKAGKKIINNVGFVGALAASAENYIIASGGPQGEIHLFDMRFILEAGRDWTHFIPLSQKALVSSLAFQPNSNMLWAGQVDGTCRLLHLQNGPKEFGSERVHSGYVNFATSEYRTVSVGGDGKMFLWKKALVQP